MSKRLFVRKLGLVVLVCAGCAFANLSGLRHHKFTQEPNSRTYELIKEIAFSE